MIDLALPMAFGFALVLFRTAGLCLAAPVFSAITVPVRVRLGIVPALAVAIFCGAGMPQVAPPATLGGIAVASLVETAVGLAGGLCARFLIDAAQAAGSVAGLSAGLGYGALVDPFHGAASTVGGQLVSILALGLAVAANLHADAIIWLARSVMTHPPGVAADLPALSSAVVVTGIWATALAVRLSFPFLAAGLMAQGALGVLNRTTPQLNLSSIGFSLSLASGGVALYLFAPDAAEVASRAAASFFARR